MAPRTRSISKAIQDVVVCAPLTTPASLTTTPCLRDFPCIGCLIVLVNWIPEDGKIFPCSDSEPARKDEKCTRCAHRSKECYKPILEEEQDMGAELAFMLNQNPLDLAAIKRKQDELRDFLTHILNFEAGMHGHYSDEADDEANQLLCGLRANVDTAVWVVLAASKLEQSPIIQRAAHVMRSVSAMVDAVRESTPPQFADLGATTVGFF